MHGMNININFGNQHPQAGMCGGPMGGFPGNGMMGSNPMMQMMQMLMQLMMSIVGGGQMGGRGSHPMPFGNPGFGQGGGMPGGCGCGGGSPMGNFLGGGGAPGYGGGYGGGFGGAPGMGGVAPGGYVPPSSQGGQRAVDVARQFLGRRSRDIKGEMPHFRAAGGLTNNCADFVSSALRGAGMLGGHEVNCKRMEQRLLREGWRRIPAQQAGPGDVAFNQSRGHVVLCQGGGKMIGSNNVRQGLQYISEKRLPQNWVVYRKG
jgi:hypothetical protein